jgi:hypothetical protein
MRLWCSTVIAGGTATIYAALLANATLSQQAYGVLLILLGISELLYFTFRIVAWRKVNSEP